jgi:hypothetical protein
VGREVVKALLSASFQVTVGYRRRTSSVDFPSNVKSIVIDDYGSVESLRQAFANQDAIVEAFSPAVAMYQEQIVQAALDADVRHIITPDFSSDTFNANVEELMILESKLKAQAFLNSVCEKNDKLTGPLLSLGHSSTGRFRAASSG